MRPFSWDGPGCEGGRHLHHSGGVPAGGLLAQTCENLLEQGITPDVYYNGHLAYERDDVKEHNDALVDKYYRRMRNL